MQFRWWLPVSREVQACIACLALMARIPLLQPQSLCPSQGILFNVRWLCLSTGVCPQLQLWEVCVFMREQKIVLIGCRLQIAADVALDRLPCLEGR